MYNFVETDKRLFLVKRRSVFRICLSWCHVLFALQFTATSSFCLVNQFFRQKRGPRPFFSAFKVEYEILFSSIKMQLMCSNCSWLKLSEFRNGLLMAFITLTPVPVLTVFVVIAQGRFYLPRSFIGLVIMFC